jgi:hypothetical protein
MTDSRSRKAIAANRRLTGNSAPPRNPDMHCRRSRRLHSSTCPARSSLTEGRGHAATRSRARA